MLGKPKIEDKYRNALYLLENAPVQTIYILWKNKTSKEILKKAIPYISETRRIELRYYFELKNKFAKSYSAIE